MGDPFMKYFTIEELCRSDKATALGIKNTPDAAVVTNLRELVENVLDPLREAWGGPITVSSGYRNKQLNIAVGGATNSHHLYGMAADITVGTKDKNRKLFVLVQQLGLPFTQLIDEYGYQWVHISYDPQDLRKQIVHTK